MPDTLTPQVLTPHSLTSHSLASRPSRLQAQRADWFNNGCACITLDREQLINKLAHQIGPGTAETLVNHYPGLFANVALFLPADEFRAMQHVIDTIEAVTASTAYQHAALADAPADAHRDPGPRGVFMGYDFHRAGDHPQLIEINTNAGGAFLNAALLQAQQACCAEMAAVQWSPVAEAFDANVIAMFREEWTRQRGQAPLQRIAIVDDQPAQQFLYPEFELARQLFLQHGIDAVIADAAELRYQHGKLWYDKPGQDKPGQDSPRQDSPRQDIHRPDHAAIDLVYNRLTDFLLEEPRHQALRQAYQDNAVVLTPHPHCYALYADKRNLIRLTDAAQLQNWGVPAAWQTTLQQSIPTTIAVTAATAETLWAERKRWFFKPARGYGSKASYRGDKLTRSTWTNILAGNYIAQAFAPPSERIISADGNAVTLKADVRIYRYHGRTLLAAARLYQGQTTNMRTPGGGFAPVFLT